MSSPNRGEVWWADLDPGKGHEQGGRRSVLVVSTNYFNSGPAGLVLVIPLTRTDRRIPIHVPIQPPEGGANLFQSGFTNFCPPSILLKKLGMKDDGPSCAR